MSEAAKALVESQWQRVILQASSFTGYWRESDRPGDPSEKSASLNTASCSYSKLQQHLDSSAESASDSSEDDSEGLCWGTHWRHTILKVW